MTAIVTTSWTKILNVLGSKPPSVLPGRTTCPVCSKAHLFVFPDLDWAGQWYFCRDCNNAGDMIDLAAKAWNKSREATMSKLQHTHCVTLPASSLGHKFQSRWQATRLFRQKLQERFVDHSTSINSLIQDLGWPPAVSLEHFAAGPGQLFGISSRKEVEDLAFPCLDLAASPHVQHTDKYRIFIGPGWSDVICIPFYDMPHRLSGCLSIGRKADPEKDFAFARFNYGSDQRPNQPHTEAGLAYHGGVFRAAKEFKHRVLAMRDVSLAIRLQCRHFDMLPNPLPVVVWHSGRIHNRTRIVETRRAWSQFYREKITFWMPELCATTLAQAIRTNGSISTLRPNTSETWDDYLGSRQPESIVRNVFASAVPWAKYLDELFTKLDASAMEELLLRLEACGIDARAATRRCSSKLAVMVKETLAEDNQFGAVQTQTGAYFTGGDSLYRGSSRGNHRYDPATAEHVSDAILEIDTVIHQPNHGNAVWCRGRVRYNGESLPFCEEQERLAKGSLTWLKNFLLQHGKGLLHFDPGANLRAFHIFMQLHPPKFVTGLDRVGWDDGQSQFVFPKFALNMKGEVALHDPDIFVGEMPGSPCEPPGIFLPTDMSLLLNGQSATLWASVVAFLANLLSHTLDKQPLTIGVTSGGEATVRAVAKSLGCLPLRISSINDVTRGRLLTKQHSYPYLSRFGANASISAKRAWCTDDLELPLNAFVPITARTAMLKKLTSTWLIIAASQASRFDAQIANSVQAVVTHYLQRLCKRRLTLPERPTLVDAIIADLTSFAKENVSAGSEQIAQCRPLLQGLVPADGADAFADLLSAAVLKGELAYGKADEVKDRPAIYHDDEYLYIPRNVFNKHVFRHGDNPPDGLVITTLLTDAEVLVGEINNCWVVTDEWWCERYSRYKALTTGALRITK